jgi:uncharacterized protein YigE (DUF2233 family)
LNRNSRKRILGFAGLGRRMARMRFWHIILGSLLLTPLAAAEGHAEQCRKMSAEGADYLVCQFDVRQFSIELFWKDRDGDPYRSLSNLEQSLRGTGRAPVLTMNAGMFHPDLSPVGLYVEHGSELKTISVGDTYGNFGLQPNGVFYVKGGTAGVMTTAAYRGAGIKPDFATQSGPMLVIDGAIHPKFSPTSTSHYTRNGVGICGDGSVAFVISYDPVTLFEFAQLFQKNLGCRNALYLDGSVASMRAPSVDSVSTLASLGPMIAVFPRPPAAR